MESSIGPGRGVGWRPIGRPGPAVSMAHRAWARWGAITAVRAGAVARAVTARLPRDRGQGLLGGGWGAPGKKKKWCGSPRRSGVDEVAGRGRCGGVPVEGGSGGFSAASRAVLRPGTEAREVVGGALERKRYRGAGKKNRRQQGRHPF
jgi:hypothetical protein